MSVTLAKAPLVELITELRWIPRGSSTDEAPTPQQAALLTGFPGGSKQEEFYRRFGDVLFDRHAFDRSERLMPAGFTVLHQPVYRYRCGREENRSIIYQVGHGMCSIHAIPPYHSWTKFLPFVKAGIEALLASRPEFDAKEPFTQVSLRYIDFFGEELMQGRSNRSFVSEVFGFSTTIPASLSKAATSKEAKSLFTRVVLPLEFGNLTVSVGDGKFNNRDGILLDTTAASVEAAPQLDAIMKILDSAYSVIHSLFFELTRPIQELMQPQGANGK